MNRPNRRQFLTVAGAGTAVLLAGCSGDDDGGNGNGNGNGNGDGNGNGNGNENGNGNGNGNENGNGNGNGDDGGVPSEVDDYLSDANQYDGSVEDMTDEDSVTVQVGAGDGLAFSPTAVRVDSGTTVTWEWTGEGGSHNVADEDGKFESELMQEEGATFEYAFEEGGNTQYFCSPHKGSGMKAAVIVE
jgi:halocyanin-like protein